MNSEEREFFVEVALSLPVGTNLHYRVPSHLATSTEIGKRVLVPLGKREVTGFVVEVITQPTRSEVKDVVKVLDDTPLFTRHHLSFYRWVSEYYFYPLGGVLKTALPGMHTTEDTPRISLTEQGREYLKSKETNRAMRLLRALDGKKLVTVRALREVIRGGEGVYASLKRLESRGLITREVIRKASAGDVKKEKWIKLEMHGHHILHDPEALGFLKRRSPAQAALLSVLAEKGHVPLKMLTHLFGRCDHLLTRLEQKGLVSCEVREIYRNPFDGDEVTPVPPLQLTAEQEEAMKRITQGIVSGTYAPFLLHGVTSSGKTEIYLSSIAEVLRRGKDALVLVPEISLTPQVVKRFRARFGDALVLLHSRLSRGERLDGWKRIRRGIVKIAIGARSAIFAPFSQIGIIIVDEEHDTSYKQEEKLRYHARDLALVRGKMEGAVVILGSATPSLESYYNAKTGKCVLLRLNERVGGKPLPLIEIVDMREKPAGNGTSGRYLSSRLRTALAERLQSDQLSMLLLNRRGFAHCVMCWECGYVFGCPNCSVALIHHQGEKSVQCHYCGYTREAPNQCPQCGGVRIQLLGWGTERLEGEIKKLFPEAQVARMDRDTTGGKQGHTRVLQRFSASRRGILIGTQMIAKGHDIPQVTLVGIVSADFSLHFPDFRSSERTFQLLTQAAGRAGRGKIPGEVIIQTFHPHHYSITASQHQKFSQFYEEEITFRKELHYPPFSRLINFKMEGNSQGATSAFAERLGALARTLYDEKRSYQKAIMILGPAPSPWKKLKGKFRYQMIIKGSPRSAVRSFASELIRQVSIVGRREGVRWHVDVDPVSLL